MKRVLIISYYFLDKSMIGSLRINGLAKYLPEFGWEPVILTVNLGNHKNNAFKIITTPYDDLIVTWKKNLGLKVDKSVREQSFQKSHKNKISIADIAVKVWHELFAYPDAMRGWYNYAIKAGSEHLSEENFDAIISSSYPMTSHLIGNYLKNKFDLPWIADLRDLWTQNHYLSYSPIRYFFERRLELQTLSSADVLTTISLPLAKSLGELHKRKEIQTIENGFDPDQMNPGIMPQRYFSIVYTGSLYLGKRDPEPLFKAISELSMDEKIDRSKLTVDFYGDFSNDTWLIQDMERYDLQDIVKLHGLITHEESINRQRNAQILLLLTWNNPNEKGVYTGKLFDYLAAQRPILSIGPHNGVIEDLLRRTYAGVQVASVPEIKNELLKSYREFQDKNILSYKGISSEINKYSQKEMARKFSVILNSLKN